MLGVVVAGFIAKKIQNQIQCEECKSKAVAQESFIEFDEYLKIISRGRLTCPSPSLCDFEFQLFGTLDFIADILNHLTHKSTARNVAEIVLDEYISTGSNFTCRKITIRMAINIFYSNLQKQVTDNVRKEQLADFKKRQRKKE